MAGKGDKENWKNVIGYDNKYKISNYGRIKSYKRSSSKIINSCPNTHGYMRVSLYNNKEKTKLVHRLVAKAFIPNPENKPEINHKDGDKTNNHVDNLEWCTSQENQQHSYDIGLQEPLVGEDCLLSKLSEIDVLDIRNAYRLGCFTQSEIAKAYSITRKNVWCIVNRKSWKHI